VYELLAATAFKGAIVLVVAWIFTLLLRRRSAASRHLVWSAAFASILLLPVLSIVLPALHVPVPASAFPVSITFRTEATGASAVPASGVQMPRTAAGYTPPPEQTDWRLMFAGLWIAGVAIAFAQMLLSFVALRRLRARSVSYPEVSELKQELGIDQDVQVLQTSSASMPMTFGFRRTVVLLPEEAAQWSPERRRIVLLHELAHVRRGDALAHLIGRVAVNLHWWNPLAWLAWRASIHERERAADDLVLSVGARASDYAAHLLEIARSMQTPRTTGAVAVAMARRSQLEGRLMAILDSAVNRRAPGRTAACVTAALAAIILLPLAAVNAQETQRVEALRKKLEEARAQYQDSHPDVQRLKKELASAQDPAATPAAPAESVEALVRTLEELRRIYTDSHPAVFEMKKKIAAAKAQLRSNTADTPERKILEAGVERMASTSPRSTSHGLSLVVLADYHRKRGEWNEARGLYTKALAILGDSKEAVPALIGLGVDALITKDQDRALGYFQKAQVLDPTSAGPAMMWTAVIRHQQNNVAEAESLFKAALAVQDPNSIDAAVTMDLYALFLRTEKRADESNTIRERSSTIRKSLMPAVPTSAVSVHRVGGGVTAPTLVYKVEPSYSEEARVAKFQGTSVIQVEIDPQGVARNARVVRWLGLGLDEKAIEAVNQWRFKPGMKNEEPVTVSATIEVNFRLL